MMTIVVLSIVGAVALGAAYAYFIELRPSKERTAPRPTPPQS